VPRVRVSSSKPSRHWITTTASITHTCAARGGGEPDCHPGVRPYCWSVRIMNGSCVFMESGDFLPTSMSAESGPLVGNCAYSSSSAGTRPDLKKTTGSSSKSPSSASRYETTRSRQLCFVQGAQRFGGPPARTCTRRVGPQEDVSRGRRGTIARCRLFPEPSRGSPQCQSTAAEFINGRTR
jgi:hypothetical protein